MRIGHMGRLLQFGFAGARHYYEVLGISMTATKEEVKSAYFRKVKEHHPDVTRSDSAAKFNQIRKAYEELSKVAPSASNKTQNKKSKPHGFNNPNDQQSQSYKQRSSTHNESPNPDQQFYSWQEHDFSSHKSRNRKSSSLNWQFSQQQMREFEKAFRYYLRVGRHKEKYVRWKPYIEEFLGQTQFQGEEGFQGFEEGEFQYGKEEGEGEEGVDQDEGEYQYVDRNVRKKHRVRKFDILYQLQIKEQQLGSPIKIKFQRQINCHKCEHNRNENYTKQTCRQCTKNKKSLDKHCPKCKGKGYTLNYDCRVCKNKGTIRKAVQEVIAVPLGVEDGGRIVVPGRGNQQRSRGGRFGDLVVQVNFVEERGKGERKEKAGESEGQSSRQAQVEIAIFEAVLGCLTTIRSTQGLTQIKIPAGTQDGTIIKNKSGARDTKQIKITIKVPDTISAEQKQIFLKLRALDLKKSL